jgi:hypothetical protein
MGVNGASTAIGFAQPHLAQEFAPRKGNPAVSHQRKQELVLHRPQMNAMQSTPYGSCAQVNHDCSNADALIRAVAFTNGHETLVRIGCNEDTDTVALARHLNGSRNRRVGRHQQNTSHLPRLSLERAAARTSLGRMHHARDDRLLQLYRREHTCTRSHPVKRIDHYDRVMVRKCVCARSVRPLQSTTINHHLSQAGADVSSDSYGY